MAYELKRSACETAEIKIGDEILTVQININKILNEFVFKYNDLLNLQKELEGMEGKQDMEQIKQVHKKMGAVVWDIINLVFGQKNAKKIVAFYENNYLEMVQEVFPFFTQVLKPAIERTANEKEQKAKEYYLEK